VGATHRASDEVGRRWLEVHDEDGFWDLDKR
jgi:hypothetical protein